MLLEKLAKQISKEVRENKTLATVDGIIAHLESEIVRLNDTKIANLHSQRLKHMLGKKSVNSVIAHHESEDKPRNDNAAIAEIVNAIAPDSAIDGFISKLVAAVQDASAKPRPNPKAKPSPTKRSNLPMPDPKFEGCWNCGARGHSRKECKKFKALIKDNGGTIPERV